jgi:undecaprenyl phosphate-alpha-L-ara4N flippase subunit ArnE
MRFVLILCVPLISTLGLLLLKMGMNQVGPVTRADLQSPLVLFVSVSTNPLILSAVALFVASFLILLILLSSFDLSYTYPLLASIYILVPLASRVVLGEQIPMFRWMGIFIISVGLVVAGWPD